MERQPQHHYQHLPYEEALERYERLSEQYWDTLGYLAVLEAEKVALLEVLRAPHEGAL